MTSTVLYVPDVMNYDSGITREFANEQISKVFTQTNNPKIHSFKAADKHHKVKETKDSAASTVKANKKTASKSQAKVSQQSEEGLQQPKAHAQNANAKQSAHATSSTVATHESAHAASSTVAAHESNHHDSPAIAPQAEAAREIALQSTADALANQQNNHADNHNAKSTDRFSSNNRQQDRFANNADSNQPKLSADDFANDTHTVASNDNANQAQDASAQQGQSKSDLTNADANHHQAADSFNAPTAHHQHQQDGDSSVQAQQDGDAAHAVNAQQPAANSKQSANESTGQQQANAHPSNHSQDAKHQDNHDQEASAKSSEHNQAQSDSQQKAAKLTATNQAIQKSWAVKVGSYTSDEDVKKSVAKLQQNGFNGFIKEIKTADGTTTEVFAGPTAKHSAALDMYNQLKKAKISGNVVSTEYNEQQS